MGTGLSRTKPPQQLKELLNRAQRLHQRLPPRPRPCPRQRHQRCSRARLPRRVWLFMAAAASSTSSAVVRNIKDLSAACLASSVSASMLSTPNVRWIQTQHIHAGSCTSNVVVRTGAVRLAVLRAWCVFGVMTISLSVCSNQVLSPSKQ